MGGVDFINSNINYAIDSFLQTTNQILSNPSASKKTLQLFSKFVAGYDYYTGKPHLIKLVDTASGATALLDGFGSVKNVIYFLNPFTKSTIDQAAFELSVSQALRQQTSLSNQSSQELASSLVNKIMVGDQNYYCEAEVLKVLYRSLIDHGHSKEESQAIISKVNVRQRSRPVLQVLAAICFTTTGFVGNIYALNKFGILDNAYLLEMGKQAALLGKQSKVFAVILEFGVDQIVGTIASVGMVFCVVDSSSKLWKAYAELSQSKTKETISKAQSKVTQAWWDLGVNSLDLSATVVPLAFTVSPPVVIGMAIVSKGAGLIKTLYFG